MICADKRQQKMLGSLVNPSFWNGFGSILNIFPRNNNLEFGSYIDDKFHQHVDFENVGLDLYSAIKQESFSEIFSAECKFAILKERYANLPVEVRTSLEYKELGKELENIEKEIRKSELLLNKTNK